MPRLLDHLLEEKRVTLVHALWQISPEFNGDMRRHNGRCHVHGPSQKAFDTHAARLAQQWLAPDPPPGLYASLEHTLAEDQAGAEDEPQKKG